MSSSAFLKLRGLVNRQVFRVHNPLLTSNPRRNYRNISHGIHPESKFTKFYHFILCFGMLALVLDFKRLFGLVNEEKELEELKNYEIPDLHATYSKAVELQDTKKDTEESVENKA